jgi:hypothetical protein
MQPTPLIYEWNGEGHIPLPSFAKKADEQFVIGQRYRMVEVEDRSMASHRHEFAWLKTAWDNLPEHLAPAYPSPEHLRKRARIAAGFCSEIITDAGSRAAAERVAATCRFLDEFALVEVRGSAVIVRRAESQSWKAMGRERFQASKTAIMEIVADMIGVPQSHLTREAA